MSNEVMCRICLGNASDTNNDQNELGKFFSPCKCAGSIKYVHQECLKRWIRTSNNPKHLTSCPQCRADYKVKTLPIFKTSGIKYRLFKWFLSLLMIIIMNVCVAYILPWYIRCIHGDRMSHNNVYLINTQTLNALFLSKSMLYKINNLDFYTISNKEDDISLENGKFDYSYFKLDQTLYRFNTRNGWYCHRRSIAKFRPTLTVTSNFRKVVSKSIFKYITGDSVLALFYPDTSSSSSSSSTSSTSSSSLSSSTSTDIDIISGIDITSNIDTKSRIGNELKEIKQLVDIDLCDIMFSLCSLHTYEFFAMLTTFTHSILYTNNNKSNLINFYSAETLFENIDKIKLLKNDENEDNEEEETAEEALFGLKVKSRADQSSKQCVRLGKFDDLFATCLFGLLKVMSFLIYPIFEFAHIILLSVCVCLFFK